MAKSLSSLIIDLTNEVENSKTVVLFLSNIKVVGDIYKEFQQLGDGVLTLVNASVCNSLENFNCNFSHQKYDKLNIFEVNVLGFSVVRKAEYSN